MESSFLFFLTDYMDALLDMVFSIVDNPRLQDWGLGVIERIADRTEAQMVENMK